LRVEGLRFKVKGLVLLTTAQEIGPETGVVENNLNALVHILSKFMHSACPGTNIFRFYHGQSEVAH